MDRTRKLPLRIALILPFVIQICIAVGLTGWLSMRNGRAAVRNEATKLQKEVGTLIQERLRNYLDAPHWVNRSIADAIAFGTLDSQDLTAIARYLWQKQQWLDFDKVIGAGFEKTGNYVEARTNDDGSTELSILDRTKSAEMHNYTVDNRGNITNKIKSIPNYDPRKRPWYTDALKTKAETWSQIYIIPHNNEPALAASQPIYDQSGNFIGVTSTNITLSRIHKFLSQANIDGKGQTFIIDADNMLVASSDNDKPFVTDKDNKLQRINVLNSNNALERLTAEYLIQRFGNIKNMSAQQLEFSVNGDRQFLQILPFKDRQGIDWVIVGVVSEASFGEIINNNIRTTFLLCLVSLAVAIALGDLTSRLIARPLRDLCTASRDIAGGNLNQQVIGGEIEEISILAQSFNLMSAQLKKSDMLKTEFLSNISHELKTPLVSILGFTKVIQKKIDAAITPAIAEANPKTQKSIKQVKDNLEIILSESQRLTKIVEHVLDITNLEAEKVVWNMQQIDIKEIVKSAVADLTPIAQSKNLPIVNDLEANLPEVIGDRNRIFQVISYLLDNALKFTEEGKIICTASQRDGQVIVSVIDTGIGISKDDQDGIFEKFKQVGDILTSKPQGTGLGLPICKEIVKHHSGKIWVESKLSEGSTFSFSLPLQTTAS
jgi:signal transduction histidine kinase